jgi:LVIVD repeat-containing protein
MGRFLARPARRLVAVVGVTIVLAAVLTTTAATQQPSTTDPRVGLAPGLDDAGVAATGLELLAHRNKPAGFFDPANPGNFGFVNSDLAFQGNFAFVGNFNGFQIYDISNPANPTLRTAVVCPGGQGEVSVFGNLLFMSVEESRGRVDCGTNPAVGTRFQGVRVFDISNLDSPVQVAAVQTCRGSHTHTLLKSPADDANLYVYVSGTAGVRPASTLAGCVNAPATNPDTSLWRIEVIRVPLTAPQNAAVINMVRLFADPATGAINGLQNAPPTPQHPSGMNWGPTPITDACHDITTYPAIGLAAGACEGNGLLIDISDPANPARIDAVADPNYAYWHGATFSNDGTKVVFTDEWGGGTSARCRGADPVTGRQADQLNWGANAIFDIVDRKLVFRSYYKMPAVQTNQENCVAHLPSLIPVPGRDILVQAWYQAGASVMEFTDSANPKEIAYYDRGPISGTSLVLGGLWSTYYYDGAVYGSEIARGFDAWRLVPNAELSQNEIDAAAEVEMNRLTPQHQPQLVNKLPSFAVARSYVDQLVRADDIPRNDLVRITNAIDRAERFRTGRPAQTAKDRLRALANQLEGEQYENLREALLALANA